ncbi:hypothetical protein PTSG_01364 [Salpingoeca rosetta]|uniref:Uncharacterized protein n=1 Tax=Salpingoeca rosetta (strain ATCC 50818 / BSB-021) TaxID=946362 RepID=F2U047_SALR5|nr:uncharacterized protein PTSG_01364 [Salpingoeca rosetta]EGD80775.1 hypothetical protein PTSG_01364 [Salpingoeca rosetta]|eukprot:XP_004997336.1 hypothetical protein PTSG_01364 [Salpingoeca rosetta]
MHRTAGAAGGDSRSVPKRGGGGQVMERKQQAVDFQALTEECLRGLEAVDVAADQLHKLRDAIKDSSLPRPLSMHIMVISGRLLRASSSLHPPLYELSRLVALYAKPWEEKGSVLAKLHQSYAEHHRQLQLALSQLQTTGADLERMKEERLHMLWERLFAKSMTNQRHGRRWKFLIESFRQAAEKGEHIHFDDGDDDDDEDDDDLDSIGDDLPGDTNGRRRRRPPLKPTSRRETRPNILVAAERRQAERERMQQEILQLKSEVRSLMQTRDDLQTRLDKALLKKPVASAACQVQLLKPPGTEAPNEVLSAVSKAIAVNKSRSAGNDLPASNGGGDADNEEQVDIGEDSAVTHVHLIHISGFADVLLPDISIEAVVRPSITSDAKDTQRIRVADALYTGDSLFVGGELELQGLFVQDVVEVRVFTGFEEAELVATGTTTARALLESIHATTSCTLKCDDGSMTTRTTFVSATISMSLRTTAAMAAFAEEAGAGRCPSFLRLTIAASHTPLSDAQIEMMTPKFEGEKRRPLRRNRVKNNLDQDDDGHRQSAEAMRQEVDIANGLFELLDVNSEDLREATFTMQEMLELTLLHTRQLQALQHQYDARIEELVAEKLALEEAKSKEHKADNTQTSGMQTDPMPEPEPVVIEKEVEKLVEVEKIVEKIVERVKVVEKYVEVPVDTGGSAGFQRRYRPPRPRFNSPFLQRLVEYARESVKRRQELSDKVQGERDREIKAQANVYSR